MSSRKYGDPKRRKSTKEKGHDRRQNSCRRSSRAQTRAKVSKKRERRAGEKNIPIIRVIAKSFAPSFESLAKWLRNSPACEQPCNFSLTCEILLFLTHASFHMLNKSLHACRLRLRTKANRCNHGHLTSRITEVIDTQHHVSLKYSKRSLCAVCRQIFPGTRSERGGNTAARRPFHHRLS